MPVQSDVAAELSCASGGGGVDPSVPGRKALVQFGVTGLGSWREMFRSGFVGFFGSCWVRLNGPGRRICRSADRLLLLRVHPSLRRRRGRRGREQRRALRIGETDLFGAVLEFEAADVLLQAQLADVVPLEFLERRRFATCSAEPGGPLHCSFSGAATMFDRGDVAAREKAIRRQLLWHLGSGRIG